MHAVNPPTQQEPKEASKWYSYGNTSTTHTHTHAHMHTHTYTHAHMHAHTHVRTRTQTYLCSPYPIRGTHMHTNNKLVVHRKGVCS